MSKGSKNLSYEMDEPAFLRRLRQQHSGGGGPDRYIAPRNKKRPTDNDDDAPTYVLDEESGETISRKEFEAMEGKEDVTEEGVGVLDEKEPTEGVKSAKESVTEVGGRGKRRKVKIIGDGKEMEKEEGKDGASGKKKKGKAGVKVKKPVKLSFGDDE